MKVLLAKRRAMGDTVLLASAVAALKAARPEAEVSVLVPRVFAPVLLSNPQISMIYVYEYGFVRNLYELRKAKFDHLIQLHAAPKLDALALLSGAKHRHAEVHNQESAAKYGRHPNALEWDALFLREIFGPEVPVPCPPPVLHLTDLEIMEGEAYWRRNGMDPRKVIFLGLGASRITKRWLPAHFAHLAELLKDRHEMQVALIPGPGEEEEQFAAAVINEMRARGMRAITAGKGDFWHGANLSLRQLAAALKACRAYVGNDSGPKHMAAAVGTPTVTIFGPEDPVEWHPYNRKQHPILFLEGLSCRKEDDGRWCGIPICIAEKHRCMRDIEPVAVLSQILAVL
jgi:ADP-heptose:LPS heptosyltransferase